MIRVRNESLSVTMEAFFSAPEAFDKSILNSFARNALERFGKYGLQSNLIVQRVGDQLFDYELSFSLFNNHAQVRLGAERLYVNLQSARGRNDFEIVVECLLGACQCLAGSAPVRGNFQSASHAAFASETESVEFFASFIQKDKNIVGGGRIVDVKEDSWLSPVRLTLERSLAFKNDVYLTWFTDRMGAVDLDGLKEIADRIEVATHSVGLEFQIE